MSANQISQSSSFSNKLILTVICYLCYFFTANIIIITGPMIPVLAKYFHIEDIGFAFTYINVSMWLGIFVIGYLMKRFSLKSLLIFGIAIGFIASLLAHYNPSIFSFKILMTAIGFCGGLFMAISSYMIVHLYNDHKIRAMNVIFTDFFFSFGGALVPIFAAYLIDENCSWHTIYLLLQIIAVIILILVLISDFSEFNTNDTSSNDSHKLSFKSWNFTLYCVAFSAFFFLLGELILTSYAPSYFQDILNWGIIESSKPISYFWTAQCVGLLLSPLITKKVPLRYILPSFMIIGTIALSCLIFMLDIHSSLIAAIIFGLFNCYIYAGLLAYGTFQIKNAPPTLITTILLFGTTGTALSTTTGAFIKEHLGLTVVMHSVIIFYVISLILIILAVLTSKENK